MILFDQNRKPTATRWLKGESVDETPLSEENLRRITESGLLKPEGHSLGCIVEKGRVLLIAACPVLHTDRSGPAAGWLVHGRWIDKEWLNESFDLIGMHVKDIAVDDSLAAVQPKVRPLGESLDGMATWLAEREVGELRYEAQFVLPMLESPRVVVITVNVPMEALRSVVRSPAGT